MTEGVAQIPTHAEKDDLGFIVTPLELDFIQIRRRRISRRANAPNPSPIN